MSAERCPMAASGAAACDESPQLPAAPAIVRSPLDLFGGAAGAPTAQAPSPPLAGDVAALVTELMVACEGRRAVRMTIDPQLMPGTVVMVEEIEGRLVYAFEISIAATHRQLTRAASELANTLASRLERGVDLLVIDVAANDARSWRGLPA